MTLLMHHDIIANPPVQCEFQRSVLLNWSLIALHLFAVIAHRGGHVFNTCCIISYLGTKQLPTWMSLDRLKTSFVWPEDVSSNDCMVHLQRHLRLGCIYAAAKLVMWHFHHSTCKVADSLGILINSYLHIEKDPLLCIGPHLSTMWRW